MNNGSLSYISQHSIDRAVERFGVKRNQAEQWIRTNFNKAKYVSRGISDEGVPNRLFAYKRICFVLEAEENRLITMYEPNIPPSIYEKVAKVVTRELRKFETEEKRVERRNTLVIAELRIELAELELRLLRARSKATINAVTARLNAINARISELNDEINEVKHKKSIVAKGVAAYV